MDSIDEKIYIALARCADAKLPILFCGDDASQRLELLSILRAQLKQSARGDHGKEIV